MLDTVDKRRECVPVDAFSSRWTDRIARSGGGESGSGGGGGGEGSGAGRPGTTRRWNDNSARLAVYDVPDETETGKRLSVDVVLVPRLRHDGPK